MGLRSCLSRLRRWFRRATPAAAPRRRLQLEALEARDVPAVVSSDTYLASLYQGFLGRVIDTPGLSFWRQVLNTTGDRTAVAAGILNSQEYQGRELQILYPTLLGRPLDNPGLTFWGNLLQSGGTYEQVKAGILGSPELFSRVGNTFSGFITSVFTSQVGRFPTNSDIAFWEGRIGSGETRQQVAADIINSDEAHLVELEGIYPLMLSRPLDPAGASFWGGVLRSGASVNAVLAGVAGSDEFFRQLANFLVFNSSTFNDINLAANGFLTAGGKFAAQLPGVEQLDRLLPTNSAIRTSLTVSVIPTTVTTGSPTTPVGPTTPVSPPTPVGPVAVGPSATTPVGPVGVGPSQTTSPVNLSTFGINSPSGFITGSGSFTTLGPGSFITTGSAVTTTTGSAVTTVTGPATVTTSGPGSFTTFGPGAVITTGPGSFTTTGFGTVPTTGMQSFITSGPGAFTSTTGPTFL
jgi:hypothetical protein